jgi:Tol biopolymer transport system component
LGGMLGRYLWSPDGRSIVTQRRGADLKLRVVDVETGARRELYDGFIYNVAWSPDAAKIVFDADPYVGLPRVFVVRGDGTGLTRLVRNGTAPRWSPDGRLVAFLRPRGRRFATVHVVRPDGTGLRQLSHARLDSGDSWGWAPDGQKLAISQYRNGAARLGILDANGAGLRWVYTGRGAFEIGFMWAADARRIYFQCRRRSHSRISSPELLPPQPTQIQVIDVCFVDLVTGRQRDVTRPERAYFWALSPDGKRIAFSGDRGVYVSSSNGGERLRVTTSGSFLSWSPDGRWISFQDKGELHVVSLDTGNAKRITRTYETGAWQPQPKH